MSSVPVSSPLLQPVRDQRRSDENKTQDTWGQEDIAESPDSDVKKPQGHNPGTGPSGRGSESSRGQKTNLRRPPGRSKANTVEITKWKKRLTNAF